MMILFDWCDMSIKGKDGNGEDIEMRIKMPSVYFRSQTGIECTHVMNKKETQDIISAYLGWSDPIDRRYEVDDTDAMRKLFRIRCKVSKSRCMTWMESMLDISEINGISDADIEKNMREFIEGYLVHVKVEDDFMKRLKEEIR